jgi:hypothetical protein
LTTFPDLRLHPRNLATDDRVALLEARMTGTNTGPFPLSETERLLLGTQAETLPPTGRATDITGVVVLEVAGGRVTAERTLLAAGRRPRTARPDRAVRARGRPAPCPWSLSLRAFRNLLDRRRLVELPALPDPPDDPNADLRVPDDRPRKVMSVSTLT